MCNFLRNKTKKAPFLKRWFACNPFLSWISNNITCMCVAYVFSKVDFNPYCTVQNILNIKKRAGRTRASSVQNC